MAPEEYQELSRLARQKEVSVAELIRTAIRERYLQAGGIRKETIDRILEMDLDLDGSWEDWEKEVEESHG